MVLFKTLHIIWNLKPMILVLWGFWTMINGTMQSDSTTSLHQDEDSAIRQSCSDVLNYETYMRQLDNTGESSTACTDLQAYTLNAVLETNCQDRDVWWCYSDKQLKENQSAAMALVAPYIVLCLIWVLVLFCSSGFYKYGYNQLGYHLNFVLARANCTYKVATLVMLVYPIIIFFYGIYTINSGEGDKRGNAMPQLFNGIIQTLLGVWGLYSSVEETLVYSEAVKESKVVPPLFADSINVIAKWQDAILAAEKKEYEYWEKITGTGPQVFKQVYEGITANSTSGGGNITVEDATTE